MLWDLFVSPQGIINKLKIIEININDIYNLSSTNGNHCSTCQNFIMHHKTKMHGFFVILIVYNIKDRRDPPRDRGPDPDKGRGRGREPVPDRHDRHRGRNAKRYFPPFSGQRIRYVVYWLQLIVGYPSFCYTA